MGSRASTSGGHIAAFDEVRVELGLAKPATQSAKVYGTDNGVFENGKYDAVAKHLLITAAGPGPAPAGGVARTRP